MESLKVRNFKTNIKYDIFIIENHLKIIIHLIKKLQNKDSDYSFKLGYVLKKLNIADFKLFFFKTLNIMNRCFKYFRL